MTSKTGCGMWRVLGFSSYTTFFILNKTFSNKVAVESPISGKEEAMALPGLLSR